MTALNKQALLIENGQLVADTLRHLADNEIDSDYFAITSTNENGTEIDHELVITDYARQAAGTVDELVMALEAAEKQASSLFKENVRLKSGIAGLVHLGIRHGDIEVMSIAGDAQLSTPCTDSIIEKIAAGIGVKGE